MLVFANFFNLNPLPKILYFKIKKYSHEKNKFFKKKKNLEKLKNKI